MFPKQKLTRISISITLDICHWGQCISGYIYIFKSLTQPYRCIHTVYTVKVPAGQCQTTLTFWIGGNLLLSLWTASRASICMATMPVGQKLRSVHVCTHTRTQTELVHGNTRTHTHRCSYNQRVYLQIIRPESISSEASVAWPELRIHTATECEWTL